MVIIIIIELFISTLLLLSIKKLKQFHKIEIIVLCLFNSFLCQHINFKIFSAYERLSVMEDVIPRVLSYFHFGVTLPLMLIWVLYFVRIKQSVLYCVFYSVLWIGFDLFSKQIFLLSTVLKSKTQSWYPITDICISTAILLFSILFMRKLGFILKKERIVID